MPQTIEPQCRKHTFERVPSEDLDQSVHCAVLSESSQGAFWIAKDAVSKDSGLTVHMHRPICVLIWPKCQKVHFLKLRLKCILYKYAE